MPQQPTPRNTTNNNGNNAQSLPSNYEIVTNGGGLAIPKSYMQTQGIVETKALDDAGWNSYGGGGMGGILGPGGGSQLSIGLSRFRSLGEFLGAYTADDTVYACTSVRAETISNLPWRLKHLQTGTIVEEANSKTDYDIAQTTPLFRRNPNEFSRFKALVKLLKEPNEVQTWPEFISMCSLYFDLTGNAIILKDNPNYYEQPEMLWPINPASVTLNVDQNQQLENYYIQTGAMYMQVDPYYIAHVKDNNPGSMLWGIGKIQVLAGVLDAQMGIDEYQRGFFANGAVLSGVIQAPTAVTPQQFKTLKAEIKDQFQGVRNHFKVALLENGMNWQNVSLSQTEMGMIEWKKFGRERVLQAYRVPPSKIGSQEDAAYEKLDAADRFFYKESIAPTCKKLERTISRHIAEKFGYAFEFIIPEYEDIEAMIDISVKVDAIVSMTTWEKRQTIKKIMGKNVVLESDVDAPTLSAGSGGNNRPQPQQISNQPSRLPQPSKSIPRELKTRKRITQPIVLNITGN